MNNDHFSKERPRGSLLRPRRRHQRLRQPRRRRGHHGSAPSPWARSAQKHNNLLLSSSADESEGEEEDGGEREEEEDCCSAVPEPCRTPSTAPASLGLRSPVSPATAAAAAVSSPGPLSPMSPLSPPPPPVVFQELVLILDAPALPPPPWKLPNLPEETDVSWRTSAQAFRWLVCALPWALRACAWCFIPFIFTGVLPKITK